MTDTTNANPAETAENNALSSETAAPRRGKKAAAADGPGIPAVLAFARSINPGHMLMFSASSRVPGVFTPVVVRDEPLRGLNATMKTKEEEKHLAVLQVVESAELAAGDDTLVLRGKVLVRNNVRAPFACNEKEFAPLQAVVVEKAVQDGLVRELATRYAINLLSGSWGWRNALESEHVAVTVYWTEDGQSQQARADDLILRESNRFDVAQYPDHAADIERLAAAVETALTREGRGTLFRVKGEFLMGEGARVYPSQEWSSESEKARAKREWGEKSEGKSRILAKVRNAAGQHQAIINDRKAGNALRVVDTWYGDAGTERTAIAAEVFGASAHQGRAERAALEKSFFGVLGKLSKGVALSPEETLYYLAVCIRGGVLGGKE